MQQFFDDIAHALGPFVGLVEAILIIFGAIILTWVLRRLIHRTVDGIVNGVKRKRGVQETAMLALRSPLESVRTVQRARTIGQVLNNIAKIVIWTVAIFWCIGIISPTFLTSLTLLSAALGAGLGFGAQRIVGDVLNGLFMVLEDQLGVGDDVDIQHASGVVESVGIRITQVRDLHGELWYVRNGEIQRVGNNSQGWNRAVLDIAIPYEADPERVQKLMLAAANSVHDDEAWADAFITAPELWGMQTLSAEAVIVRLVAKVRPGERVAIESEIRKRLQQIFKMEKISLPPMNTIVFDGPNGISPTRATGLSDRRRQQDLVDDGTDPRDLSS